MGSGCGSVGRAVASDSRDLRSNLNIGKFYLLIVLKYKIEKTKIKKKEAGKGPHLKKYRSRLFKDMLLPRH